MISDKRIAIKFLLVVLLRVFVSGDVQVRCIESEREALLSFKHGLIDERGTLLSWQSNECCEWNGVECSNTTRHVITLDLSRATLRGKIGSSLVELHHLNYLDISGNDFGSIPIPKFIGSMKQLQHLNLNGSAFYGTFPPQIGNLTNLRSLDLSFNSLSFTSLTKLGPLLGSLEILDLSSNQLSSIPDLRAFSSLKQLHLSRNNFKGSIPFSIGQLSKLQVLDLSHNSLEGLVPLSFSQLSKLQVLDLSNNSLTRLVSFDNLQNLVALQLHGNNLSGQLPYSLRVCQKLRFIDVGGNKLTGEIPTWIGQMYKMQFLNLRGNKLHGSIPSEICNLTDIQVVDLSINNLSSIIPDCFNNFTVLASNSTTLTNVDQYLFGLCFYTNNEHYGYSSFEWKGHESEFMKNIELLKLIDFSSNRLTGNIPKSFSTMRGIKSLNLSRNSLSGHIIPDIGKMEMLDSLDLSHNELSGKIPTSLAEIHTLGVLDLSSNNLSGKIPTSTQLQSFVASTYAGNDGLCGDPLPKCPEDSLRPSITNPGGHMREKDHNYFSFMEEVGISMTFGFIFGFWGVIGSFILKKSWRIAIFNLFDDAGDWFYVKIVVFVSKWK